MPKTAAAIACLCLFPSACGSVDRADDEDVVRRVSGDTVFVHNIRPVWPDTARFEVDLLIGAAEGPDEYTFSNVSALTVDAEGAVYVADRRYGLRKYAASGEFVREIGRDGSGPGEYRFLVGIDVMPDGRLLARDAGNGRINVYGADGESTDHWRVTGESFGGAAVVSATEGVFARVSDLAGFEPGGVPRGGMARIDAEGLMIDTIWVPGHLDAACPRRLVSPNRMPVPMTPLVQWTFGSTASIIVGCPATYSFDVLPPDGSVMRVSRQWEPVPIRGAEQEFWRNGLTAQMRMNEPGWDWQGPGVPDHKPAYRAFLVGSRGRIWVQTPRPSYETDRPSRMPSVYPDKFWVSRPMYDVFEADGRYLGPLMPPENVTQFPMPLVYGDTVWAVSTDDDDVPYVTRYLMEVSESE